jgi:threonine dehydrogenase-like Zn-dependent dehydrogenase
VIRTLTPPWQSGTPSYSLAGMRQLVFHGPWKLAVEEADPPPLAADEVRIAVPSVGVCGSDIHGYAGVNARRQAGMVMGHEAVGTVADVGAAVESIEPGRRVVVDPILSCGVCELCLDGHDNLCESRRIYGCVPSLAGAYAETFDVRAANVVPFEGSAPTEWGALVEPLSVGARAVRVGEVGPADEVFVVGGGPIGVAAALAARRCGAARVLVSEPLPHRREVAERLGLETLDPRSTDAPRSEFPVAIECVGHSETLAAALGSVRPRGRVVFVGLAEETIQLPTTPLMVGERSISGSSAYAAADFRATAEWVASAEDDLAPLIESRVDLDGLPDVFDGYARGTLVAMKTLLQPGM